MIADTIIIGAKEDHIAFNDTTSLAPAAFILRQAVFHHVADFTEAA